MTKICEADVLVMGAGLAGISAAIAAAESGASVCLVSSSVIFSGSSFYPGTWGLGLIAPEKDSDIENLARAITDIGEQVVVPGLVTAFAGDIQRCVNKLEGMGCKLKRPVDSGQREYIPCFDYKNRNWYGIMQRDSVRALAGRLEELGVTQLEHTEIIDCVMREGRVCGAVAVTRDGSLGYISCGALVLAGGGMGGIFRYRLNTSDVMGVGQFLALRAGASLINAEFFQIFLGYISPAPKTIYNEKMFRYTNFCHTGTDRSIFESLSPERREELLEQRSSHGPFTSRLGDREVDSIIAKVLLENERGVEISYNDTIKGMAKRPEFIETYFEWLRDKKHLTIDDKVLLGLFAHASNGGIAIDADGFTGVPGLYACGECTGGMHGADRIGGLSTANCLVFGNRAGRAAAGAGRGQLQGTPGDQAFVKVIPRAKELLDELQGINSATLMVAREQKSLETAAKRRAEIAGIAEHSECDYLPDRQEISLLRDSLHLRAALALTDCVQQAALLRAESRGGHYRTDYPEKEISMARCIVCNGVEKPSVSFAKGL